MYGAYFPSPPNKLGLCSWRQRRRQLDEMGCVSGVLGERAGDFACRLYQWVLLLFCADYVG